MTEKEEVARSAEMEQRDFRIRYHVADSEGAAWKQYWLARACDVLDDATAVADQFGVPNRNALERIERYVCEAAETLKEGKARSVQRRSESSGGGSRTLSRYGKTHQDRRCHAARRCSPESAVPRTRPRTPAAWAAT